jgi:hypothetical protein
VSVQRQMRRGLLGFVVAKTVRDVCCTGSGILQALSKLLWSFGDTALAVESHFGKRYNDLTDRDLGAAMGQYGRHEMTPGQLESE